MGLRVGLFLLVLAAADYWWQRREFENSIKMSKEEIKEEYKQLEGDPMIRSRIRQRQRQMAQQRMMQAIPTADVIITNPTHYAVAVKYTPGEMNAPKVVAKGRGPIAQRIKEEGQKHRITTVENVELARALYDSTEVGQEIPADLYPAVAEVLAFVYRLRKKTV
jgi:flagellar biosynthetic protein FlhB